MKSFSICAIVKDEGRYIEEWVVYHSLIGVSDFYIYDNGSTDETLNKIEVLKKFYKINLLNWDSIEGKSPQLTAYLHCAKSNTWNDESYLAFIDVDEFISLGSMYKNVGELLNIFGANDACILINQRIFGSSGEINYIDKPVTERFYMASQSLYKENQWVKSICNANKLVGFNNSHVALVANGNYINSAGEILNSLTVIAGHTPEISEGVRVFHYILKSKEEYSHKRKRGGVAAPTKAERDARHDDNYFIGRDGPASLVVCDDLIKFAPLVLEKLSLIKNFNS